MRDQPVTSNQPISGSQPLGKPEIEVLIAIKNGAIGQLQPDDARLPRLIEQGFLERRDGEPTLTVAGEKAVQSLL